MGNSPTPLTDYHLVRTYRQEQWIKQNYDHNGELWRSKFTHQLVRIYPLRQIPSIQDMHRYQLRSTHQYIVKVYNIAIDHYSSVCTSNQNALLLVQHIPLKLIDIRSLDLQESLTVLHSAFRGFHTIQSLFQGIEPSQQLIGFNEQGKTKVWLNRQLNQNYVAKQKKPIALNQFSRVMKIVQMIEKKTTSPKILQCLKNQILQNSVNYFQASIIVQQFSFKEQLSLKRYVRTDILTRQNKSETHRRNLTMSTFFPSETSNINTARKSDIYVPASHMQKIKSWDRLPVIQTNNPVRYNTFGSPAMIASKSIPKITFNTQSGIERPLIFQKNQPKITFSSPKAQQRISFLSTTSSMWSSPVKVNQSQKIQETITFKNKQPTQTKQQAISKNEQTFQQSKVHIQDETLKEPKQQKVHETDSKVITNEAADQKAYQNVQFPASNTPILNLQISQKKNSIIDECQKYLQESKLNQEVVQQLVNQEAPHQSHQFLPIVQNSSDIQESGMFRQVIQLQHKQVTPQIAQDQKQSIQNVQQAITLHLQSQTKQMPINFQSFAVQKVKFNQNVSFAPKLALQNIQEKGIAETSKSVDWQKEQQKEQESLAESVCESNQYVEQPPKKSFRLVQSQQRVQNKPNQPTQERPYLSNQYTKLIGQNRISLELEQEFSAIGREEKPFYEEYTPVQSKFDIMIKRDSRIDRDKQASEHSNRLSAFGNVEDDECYQRNIKNKLKEIFPSEDLRINRISSEYETNTKRLSQDSPRQTKIQAKFNKISNIHEGAQQDFLDINNLERTLQMRCSKKEKVHKKSDDFDVEKLQEKLMKFSSSKGQISKESQNSNNQSRQTFHQPKLPSKVSQFSVQKNENHEQITQKQLNSPKKIPKVGEYSPDYKLNNEFKISDVTSNNYHQQSTSRYKNFDLQKDFGDRTTNKFNSYSYNQYSQLNSFQTQSYNEGFQSYLKQKPSDIYQKYASSSYNDRFSATLPQFSKIKKQTDTLLEQRYQKYVKQGKQKQTLSKQKSVESIAKTYNESKQHVSSQTKRISYDNLRQFLWS